MDRNRIFADFFVEQLVNMGYSTCFFLGGGNILHLLDAARKRMNCIAVTHENSAGIAAEYFNVANRDSAERAVVFVTAGPGVSNIMSAIGGSWLESRELLVVAGQARTEFLSRGTVRQVGHQEIDGVGMTSPITKASFRVESPMCKHEIQSLVTQSKVGRKGPVFIELCLDVAASELGDLCNEKSCAIGPSFEVEPQFSDQEVRDVLSLLAQSERPLILVGQGTRHSTFAKLLPRIRALGIPVATSWNAADYLDYDDEIYAGRPNTYGMRWSNVIIQQADLLLTFGASLGVQQTGFNWKSFVPNGEIVRVDLDQNQLDRPNPRVLMSVCADAAQFLTEVIGGLEESAPRQSWREWINFIGEVRVNLPVSDFAVQQFSGYAEPIQTVISLSHEARELDAALIPCSSGGAYTTVMQAFSQRRGQLLTNNKGLASMGYGLAGAIGTAIAQPRRPVFLVEGDGGFAQNLSEVGTVAVQRLNLKMIIFDNGGYASIRLSQLSYFDGAYMGCDFQTGLNMPDWTKFFEAYEIPSVTVRGPLADSPGARELLRSDGPGAIIVKIHPEQAFIPKILSKIAPSGEITSDPIHRMHPPLGSRLAERVMKFLESGQR